MQYRSDLWQRLSATEQMENFAVDSSFCFPDQELFIGSQCAHFCNLFFAFSSFDRFSLVQNNYASILEKFSFVGLVRIWNTVLSQDYLR
jgi:hypothetical protein